MKMWDGRFSKSLNKDINSFNSSISFDFRMYEQDINGSVVHAKMLAETGIITVEDSVAIIAGLKEILQDIDNEKLVPNPESEDVHMFIEEELTRRVGDAGKRLHTARSRNDQVALDLKMYLRAQCDEIVCLLVALEDCICEKAGNYTDSILPGYTHLQRAQPISFAHHLLAYGQMFRRDLQRVADCKKRMLDGCPLGSGALAGTTYPIDRHVTAAELGFTGPAANSIDGVSDRDFCAELGFCVSLIMTHLSRFSEEIILWSSWEFKFIELDDAFATGSSIMPQKKNPDIAELVRGKSGRVYGDLMSLLTMLKGLPLAYNKDMQEDKEAIFDAVDTAKECLSAFTPMLATMEVLVKNMRKAAANGFINATDCADYLVKKQMPFRDAYKITGQLVSLCIKENKTLETLGIVEYKEMCPLFEDDIFEAINLENCLNLRISFGGPCANSTKIQIKSLQEDMRQYK